MKKRNGLSSREMKRKLGINASDIWKAYGELKEHVGEHVLDEVHKRYNPNMTIGEALEQLKGKMSELDRSLKEMKSNDDFCLNIQTRNHIKINYQTKTNA